MIEPESGEGGFTLIEVLITIMIVGIGVVGLIFGLITVASGSTTSQKYADVREQLAAAAERIQAAPYQPATSTSSCDSAPTSAYNIAIAALTAPKNASGPSNTAPTPIIKRIDYWTGTWIGTTSGFVRGSDNYTDAMGTSRPGCYYDTQSGSSHMQRITLGFSTASMEQLTFVKRQP